MLVKHNSYYRLLGISICFSLLLLGGFLLPKNYEVIRSIDIDRSHQAVYPYINDLQQWSKWTTLNQQHDPSLQLKYSSKSQGEGAWQSWKSKQLGNGQLTIKESYPLEGVKYVMHIDNDFHIDGQLKITPNLESESTKITWIYRGNLGNNPVLRYIGLNIDNALGKDLETGLQQLKSLVEDNP